MAYGGPPMGPAGAAASSPAMKQVKLDKESELRVEVNVNASLRLRLLNGTAEIFGTEMPPENWLVFPPRTKFAIFTWYGATIEMQDNTETDYVADETPMISYVNVHAVLEGRRNRAKAAASDADASQ
nr:protein CLP1 homolog [Tanacetum cinerariifolium]